MVELLANLGNLVARRCVGGFDRSSVSFALEHPGNATQMEQTTSDRGFGSVVVARCPGRKRIRRMASNFGPQLSRLVYLRTHRHLDGVSIYAAGDRDWNFYSLR